jgi:hypothetical protein
MVVGYVETTVSRYDTIRLWRLHRYTQMEVAIPTIPAHAPAPRVDAGIAVRAVLVTACGDLDMDVWNAAIEEEVTDGDKAQMDG